MCERVLWTPSSPELDKQVWKVVVGWMVCVQYKIKVICSVLQDRAFSVAGAEPHSLVL